ncbi:RTA1-like protein, partial [Epithele typhae]|uniref:RTA1-like protein n=1 Tax=Epithele typhae TaxID=378194 RepID=UPI00200884E0
MATVQTWMSAALVLAACVEQAQGAYMPVPWVFTDPKNDPYNPLRYIVSNTLTAIAISLVLAVALAQSWLMFKYGGRCMLSMLIGEFAWVVGFGVRIGLHSDPDSTGKYIAYYLFIVLSPCAFIASDSDKHLLISPERITVVFVVSDISTFLVQAAGAGLSISKDQKLSKTGEHVSTLVVFAFESARSTLCVQIFLAGLVLQLASFFLFMLVVLRFLCRVRKMEPSTWAMDAALPWHRDWRTLAGVLIVSSVGILVRCVYRVSELSQGYHGHLATTEVFFYALDSLPLFVAIA